MIIKVIDKKLNKITWECSICEKSFDNEDEARKCNHDDMIQEISL